MVRTVIPFHGKGTPPQDAEALRLVEAMTHEEAITSDTAANAPNSEGDVWKRRELEAVWDAVGLLDAADFAEQMPVRRPWWPVAAGIAAAVVLGLGVFYLSQRPTVYETSVGERRPLVLADGSRVTLNTDSRIEVRGRKVELTRGEALFEVAHKADARPFDVITDQARVRVTGTRFNVRLDEGRTGVDLIEGHVEVRGQKTDAGMVRLDAGQAVEVDDRGRVGRVHTADTDGVADWLQGRLTFDNTPLSEAVAEMNRYSRRKLVLADAGLKDLSINGEFQSGDVLAFSQALQALYRVDVEVQGETLVLRDN